MRFYIFESNEQLGKRAAEDAAALLRQEVAKHGQTSIILATGNSMLTFMSALRTAKDIPWDKVALFHQDEYLGLSEEHPASFAGYIREKMVAFVHPAAYYPIRGNAPDVKLEMQRYADLLRKFPPTISIVGIGENGHLAFNDPPADFETKAVIHEVDLDLKCRMQQVNEGHFQTIDQVPSRAITLTIPALLAVKHVLAVVPEARKAQPVKAALEGPVTPYCPASILRTKPNVTMYLDRESSSFLSRIV